jgi:hypothetical protein
VFELCLVATVIPFRVPSGRRRLPERKVTVEKSRRANGQAGNQLPTTPSGCPPSYSNSPLPPNRGPAEAAPCSCRQLVSAPMAISQLCVHGARCMFRTGLVPKSIRSSHHRDPVSASRVPHLFVANYPNALTCVSCPVLSSVVQHRVGGAGPLHPRVVAIRPRLYPS